MCLIQQNVFDTTVFAKEYPSGAADCAPLSFHPEMFHTFNKTQFNRNYSMHISKLFQKNK